MKQLSGQDNAFLDLEKMGMPQHISSLSIYDQGTAPGGRVRFKQILAHLESRLHLSPLFRSKLLRVPGGLDRPYRVLDAVTLDFAEVRAIKNSLKGATINDVLLSVIAGALHKYLNARGELPGENLSCGCPVDVRDENERNSGGNVVGLMGVNLHTEIADPWQRFVATHEASVAGGKHAHASDVRINREIIDTVPGGLMTTALRVSAAIGVNVTPYNTMLTNVPGPPNPLYFAGAQLVDGFGIGPLIPRIGLFHTASSTVMNKQGRINLSFWACRDMLPDPAFYRECIEASYAELRTVAAHQAG